MILEQPTVNEQRWLLGLTFSLMLCFIAVAWINREPLCIESQIVRRLEYRAGASNFDLYRCSLRQHVGYEDVIAEDLPALNARLAQLDLQGEYLFGADWDGPSYRLRIVDRVSDPDPEVLELNVGELAQPGLLEAKLMDRVLRRTLAKSDGPSAELLSVFVRDLAGYPGSANADEIGEGSGGDWKLALYGEAVRRARGLLPIGEQLQVLTEWRALLNQPDATPWALPTRVQSLMHESLAAFGYRQDLRAFQIPFAVMWPDRDVQFTETQLERIQRLVAAVVLPERIYFPFTTRAFSRLNSPPVQVGRLVLFQCGVPRLDDLEKLGLEFEHLLFVQSCDGLNTDLVVAALRNPRHFVKDYPEVDFAQIHWPSLRLALERAGVHETNLANLFRADHLASFRKIGFLTGIDHDPVTGVRTWKGALEAIPMFRLNGGGPVPARAN